MPLQWDAPIGAGGSGRHRWTAPRERVGGGGQWIGGASDPVIPNQPNREVSRETTQQPQWNQAAVDASGDPASGFSPYAGPMSPQEAFRAKSLLIGKEARLKEHADKMAMADKESAQWRLNLQRPQVEAGIQQAKLEPAHIQNWYKSNASNLEGVIAGYKAKGELQTPAQENEFRQGFASQSPEFMQHFGQAFSEQAQQQKAGVPVGSPPGTPAPAPQSWSSGSSALLHPSTYPKAILSAVGAIPKAVQWLGQTAIPNAINPWIPENSQKIGQ